MTPQIESRTMPSGSVLTKHPEGLANCWKRFTVEMVRAGQAQAYGDSVYEALITLEGGTRSTVPGFDLIFAIGIDAEKVKQIAAVLVHPFGEDPYGPRLNLITKEDSGTGWARWRVQIVTPYMG